MTVTPEMIMQVRYEVQDVEPGLYLLDDTTIEYFLTKNNESVSRASLDCARAILMQLSIRSSDETVDIFSIKGSKAAEAYRQALMLYIKDANLNPILNNVQGYAGGISRSDMEANDTTADNNYIVRPSDDPPYLLSQTSSSMF